MTIRTDNLLDASEALTPLLIAHRDEGERERRLPLPVVEAMTRAGLFHMFVPVELGGGETDLPTVLRVFEAVSRVDGAAGWNLMIGATSALVLAHLADGVARQIVSDDPDLIMGGSANPRGRATVVDGGYRVTARWPFGSGCQQCTWLGGAALVFEDGAPRPGAGGQPEVVHVLFRREQCEILDTWYVGGLRGTGSHDFAVRDLFVPSEHAHDLFAPYPGRSGGVWAIPFVTAGAAGIAAVALGIARAAIDALVELAAGKVPAGSQAPLRDRPAAQSAVARAEALLRSARAFLFDEAQACWRDARETDVLSLERRALLRLASTHAVAAAKQAVDLMYETGGATSIYERCPLERCFRDIHAVSQHIMVATPSFQAPGRVQLGLSVDGRFV